MFDDDFKLVEDNSGVRQVKESPDELQELGVEKMPVEKSGFLYVYTSNESQQDVFFDNIVLGVASGPLLEETHYYPFGLTMAGISTNALKGANYAKNRKELNGIEHTTDLDLNQYDAFYRTLDPQMGRWMQLDPKTESMEMWSPYASMYNNPIRYSDLLGDSSIAPESILVKNVSHRDGDQTGIIITATEEERAEYPVMAAVRDLSHAGLTFMGLNAIDNFIANRFNPENNSPGQIIEEAIMVGVATTRGEGEMAPVGEGVPKSAAKIELPQNVTDNLISPADAARIQNAADRINRPINLVGSRANGTAKATSDWDYVVHGMTNKEWKQIKNSIPGAPSRADNLPRQTDIFTGPLIPNRPFIQFLPKK